MGVIGLGENCLGGGEGGQLYRELLSGEWGKLSREICPKIHSISNAIVFFQFEKQC